MIVVYVFCGYFKQATASSGQAPRVVEQQSAATGPAQEVVNQSPRQLPPQPTSSKIIPSLSKVITFSILKRIAILIYVLKYKSLSSVEFNEVQEVKG